MSLNDIFVLLPDLSMGDRKLIERAYHFAEEAHHDQKRKSGEPFFIHCVAVAIILAEMKLDAPAIAAGLMHDVIEDTGTTLPQLETEFGLEVAQLVDGVSKIIQNEKLSEPDYLRKTLYSMSNDVRVILIKLADRWHNMKTLGSLKAERQKEIAEETMHLFVPLANRLGIWRLKAELEDLCFRYLEPETYRYIAHLIQERHEERENFIQQISAQLQTELNRYHIRATIQGRPKYLYSIYRKMQRKQISFEETYDVRGIRVIVSDRMTCYQALGVVHSLWRPVRGQFDDYIGNPKDNFYQSLHTAVFGEDGKPFEVQIRTWDMHNHAEYGIASHWRYKSSHSDDFSQQVERRMIYLRNLLTPAETEESASAYLEAVMEDIHDDRVFAFTPKGDVIDLPRGATPIDFAYHIHTEVGHRCRGARVNNKLVPLDYPIKSGERIEIITSHRGGPNLDWLDESLNFVRTNRARSKIREWFKQIGQERQITLGREALEQRLRQLGIEMTDYEMIRITNGYQTVDDMLEAIGKGMLSATRIAVKQVETQPQPQQEKAAATTPIIIGTRGYDVRIARCCKPDIGDPIVGYITQRATVTVHRADCQNLRNNGKINGRLVSVSWGKKPSESGVRAPVEIRAYDRAGLMGEIGNIAAQENINMSNVSINTSEGIAIFNMTMEIDDYSTLSRALNRIKSLENVIEARRRSLA